MHEEERGRGAPAEEDPRLEVVSGTELEAVHAFERIDARKLNERAAREAGYEWLGSAPAMLRHPRGLTVACLRYGVVVFFGGDEEQRGSLLKWLESQGNPRRAGTVESEMLEVFVDERSRDRCSSGELWLSQPTIDRLTLASEVLARSVLLASYEETLRDTHQLVDPLAQQLASLGVSRHPSRALLKQIGTALSIRLALVSRAEVTESPDLLWERPELERLFHQLMVEFEIRARSVAITDKLGVLSDTAETALDLVQHSQTLRVEWYIVVLIIAEIVLSLLTL